MNDLFGKLGQFWKKRTAAQRVQILLAVVIVIVLVVSASVLSNKVEYVVLFSGMSEQETSTIYTKLKDMGVDVKPRGTQTLLVPAGQADDLRLTLNEEGLPETGYNYDIFNNFSSFGATEADKQVVLGFQLEQNIAQTLRRMEKVEDALVKVTLPKDSKFALSSDQTQPSLTSVMLTLKGSEALSADEADAIRDLVEKSVPQLKRENITITDSNMKVYRMDDPKGTGSVNQQIELQVKMQEILKEQVYNLLTPVFGPANISVAVNLTLDFDKKLSNSVKYDPPDDADNMGIIISMKEVSEQSGSPSGTSGSVGTDPNGSTPTYPTTTDYQGSYYKQSKELNAEVNETKEQIETAQGKIKTLAVSVILNGDQQLESVLPQIRSATANAIGVAEENISVLYMPFEYNNSLREEYTKMQENQQKVLADQQKRETITTAAIGGGVLLLVLVLFLLLRPKKKVVLAEPSVVVPEPVFEKQPEVEEEESPLEKVLKEEQMAALTQIQKMVEKNPESVAQLLRNWLFDQ